MTDAGPFEFIPITNEADHEEHALRNENRHNATKRNLEVGRIVTELKDC
jgi:hypothetical protein